MSQQPGASPGSAHPVYTKWLACLLFRFPVPHPSLSQAELLAPAGDWEALRAAVANGADAVYFGLANFNARHRATNFTLAELPQVIDYLHGRNVRGYVTLNTLIFS